VTTRSIGCAETFASARNGTARKCALLDCVSAHALRLVYSRPSLLVYSSDWLIRRAPPSRDFAILARPQRILPTAARPQSFGRGR